MTTNVTTKGLPPAPAARMDSGWRWTRRHSIATACAAALLAVIVGVKMWWAAHNAPPPLNAPIVDLVRFCASSSLKELPFERQQVYMKELDSRRRDVAGAYQKGKLTRDQCQAAVNLAWCGKHLDHMRVFFDLPEGQARDEYIGGLAKLKEEKTLQKHPGRVDKAGKSGKSGKSSKKLAAAHPTTEPAAAVSGEEEPTGLPKAEASAKIDLPRSWPAEVTRRWVVYYEALQRAEREIDQERRDATQNDKSSSGKKHNKKSSAKKSTKKNGGAAAGVSQPAGAD